MAAAAGDLPLTPGLFSVSRGAATCLRPRRFGGEDVGSAGSSTTPRPSGSLEHGH